MRHALAATLLAAAALLCTACDEEAAPPPAATTQAPRAEEAPRSASLEEPAGPEYLAGESDGKLHVWFFDVGQGDGILIQGPTGKTVLIDGGPTEAGAHLSHRLPDLLRGPIDLVIATQPEADHVGALLKALPAVSAKRFLDIGVEAKTPEYLALLHHLRERDIEIFQPSVTTERKDDPFRIALGGGAELQVLWPRRPAERFLESPTPLRANSLVARLVYKQTSVLFAADMTAETERLLIQRGFALTSTVLKVSMHGADGASTQSFLAKVRPEAAIISVGAGNDEGAPSHQTLSRLGAVGAQIFRTDLDGEIRADSDGASFVLVTERPAAGEPPETPHLFGALDTESGAKLAKSVVEDVVRTRKPPRVTRAEPRAPKPPGKVIHVRPLPKQPSRTAASVFHASRNSEVFHVPECPWAQKIMKKNLIVFNTRGDAQQSGRRPAGDCNP